MMGYRTAPRILAPFTAGTVRAHALRPMKRLAIVAAALALLMVACGPSDNQSYNDGYEWGMAETVGIIMKTAPSCSQTEMVSSGPVSDPNFIFNKPQGADEPSDDFAQWSAGCKAGAQQTIQSFNSP
jgi:hypothetical protein